MVSRALPPNIDSISEESVTLFTTTANVSLAGVKDQVVDYKYGVYIWNESMCMANGTLIPLSQLIETMPDLIRDGDLIQIIMPNKAINGRVVSYMPSQLGLFIGVSDSTP